MSRALQLCVVCFSFFAISLLPSFSAALTELEVTTFNMRWFGLRVQDPRNGDATPIDPVVLKKRAQVMQDFIAKVVSPKDVAVFEEVVDLKLLRAVLPRGWSCASYDHRNPHHQHVAICAAPKYKLLPVPYDRDAAIEEIAIDTDWGRPGVRVDLATQTGTRLLRVVGLHLKSAPAFTKDRATQMQMVARDLSRDRLVPTLITGDMNTYWPNDTKLPKPDVKYLESELKKFDPSFQLVSLKEEYTFRSKRFLSQFDQFFLGGAIRLKSTPAVFKVCNQTRDGQGYLNFPFYYENVSDHCPVKVTVEVP